MARRRLLCHLVCGLTYNTCEQPVRATLKRSLGVLGGHLQNHWKTQPQSPTIHLMAKSTEQHKKNSPRIANRKAWHDYEITEVVEAGIALVGTEVKSLRAGQARIDEAHARIRGVEVYLIGSNIAAYPQAAPGMQHEPARDRKLLLHKRQIAQLVMHVRQRGNTIVPLAAYFKGGWAKVELGLAIGKKAFDKRQDLKKREHQRDMQREMRKRR